MASYLSKVPDFGTYQPEVNAELYGKLLVKKQSDYEAGLEKAQKDIDYIASLPVAREADRSYLQEIINSVTSEINEGAFTDWSNLSVQKLTKKHITRLANDSNIQNAVSSASVFKTGHNLAKTSEEQNEGKDAANQYDWQQQLSPWLNSTTPGEKFNGRFNSFVDIWEDASKVAEEVPIEEWTETSNLADIDAPNKTALSREFKGRSPQKVINSVLGYLNTDPGASNQLALQAKYEYKDYDVNRTAAELFDKDKTALSHYEQEYNELNEQLRRLGDQSNPIILKKRQEIQSRQRALLTEFNKESEDLYAKNRVIAEEAFSDNDKKNQLFKKLYTDKFVQQRVENYAFNNKGKVSVIGETAFMKGKKVEENIRANEEHEWGREKHNAEMKKLVKENTDSQYGLAYAPGIPTDLAKNSYGAVKKNIDDEETNTSDAIRRVAYNIFKNNGGFTALKENSEGGVDIVNPYTIATIPGQGPTKIPTGIYLTGGKWKDEKGVEQHYDGFINQLIKSYKSGDYKKVVTKDGQISMLGANAGTFNISDIDLPSIISLSESIDLLAQKKDMITRKEKEIMDKTGTTNLLKSIKDNPINELYGGIQSTINDKDILIYNSTLETVLEKTIVTYNAVSREQQKGYVPYDLQLIYDKLKDELRGYGTTPEKLLSIHYSSNPRITAVKNNTKVIGDQLNKEFEKMNIILTPSRRDWTGLKEEDKKERKNVVINYAQLLVQNNTGELMKAAEDVVKILTEKGTSEPEIAYTQDALTKEYKLAVTRDGETKEMPISAEQARQWNWDPMIGERTRLEEQILWSPTKSTVPLNKQTGQPDVPSFYNAKSIGVVRAAGKDIRYHIVPEYTAFSKVPQYYIYYYEKNVHTGKEEPVDHRPIPNNDLSTIDAAIDKKRKEIEASNNKR